ncbi:right-handed parallel beta-helix repeat-containing protein [Kitasatospora sp. NPDC001527]|uniref:right-handed parallel beta-helix repeat-containing protein n=1 Tax=Kitasatospora sp. NPDC001527 TaxID=3154519 RepID=UPI003330A518
MPVPRRAGLALAIAGSAVAGTALPFTAYAESTASTESVASTESTVLHVDNGPRSNCSDSGSGTRERPFCTVQAAADVAGPGQTVQLAPGRRFTGQVTVRRSGEPGRPIVFQGAEPTVHAPDTSVGTRHWARGSAPAPHAFVFEGVHDVTVTGLRLDAPQEGVLVKDSTRIAVDHNDVEAGDPVRGGVRAFPAATPSVRITGAGSYVTVSRNRISAAPVSGVAVDAGTSGVVVTTNLITGGAGRGVLVTDAPGTIVVGNTFGRNCGSDLEFAGNSTGSVAENNILAKRPAPRCGGTPPTAVPLVVSAGSVRSTRVDYNTVVPWGPYAYSWGDTPFATPEAFRAVGQGASDNAVDPGFAADREDYTPAAVTGVTDAADPTALGTLATDLLGAEPADHPRFPGSTAWGYRDRGAIELQDPLRVRLSARHHPRTGHPLNARFAAGYTTGWAPGTATLDFGDGSAPRAVDPGYGFVDHDYPAAGTYTATLTAGGPTGPVRTSTARVTVGPAPIG